MEEAKALVNESIARFERQVKAGVYLVDRPITLDEALELIDEN